MNQVLDPNTANYYAAYGEQASASLLPFLKFQKGDWTVGQNDKAVPSGTEFIADMATLKTGWTRWFGGKPTDTSMVSVNLGQVPCKRHDLPDNDPELWEKDASGPRDPWQFTNTLELVDPENDDIRVMLSLSSRGGINAMGALCKEYGSHMRLEPDNLPVIALGADSYKHTTYGKVWVPVLEVVAWSSPDGSQVEAEDSEARVVDKAIAGSEETEERPSEKPEPAARQKVSSRPAAAGKTTRF